MKKVIVSMSGGVDSSVSAYLLQKKGYYVEGLFMKNWEEDDKKGYCASAIDLSDAQIICCKLGIKLHTINFATEYWNNVFEPFLFEYKIGRTPNPDILCNKEIKFKTCLDFITKDLGADYMATGHYVRSININGKNKLLRGLDNSKDQSYFLYTLSYKQISKIIFPLGNMKKSETRKIAEKLEFLNARKKGSTGICFIGKRKFYKFLRRYLPENPGKIIDIKGKEISEHRGLMYYTLGQRKGLGIGGIKNNNNGPWYVVDKNINNNTLIVAQGLNNPHLMSIGLIAKQIYWVSRESFIGTLRCSVKTRYHQNDTPCLIKVINKNYIEVRFDYPITAVTPGQSAVFYNGEVCLGGGIIENRILLNNLNI